MGNHIDAKEPTTNHHYKDPKSAVPTGIVDLSEKSLVPAANNGGPTDYYRIDSSWTMAQDIIEDRNMNYSQGNIFKAAFTFNIGRHDASSYERELNKIIYFANRELEQIKDN